MKFGIVGLGRMGVAIAERVLHAGHEVFGYDLNQDALEQARTVGITTVNDIIAIAQHAETIWLMLPAGQLIDKVLETLKPHLGKQIIIDGGNSNFKDSMRRANLLAKLDIPFLDCGTSGGLKGREMGFSLMVGGTQEAYAQIEPILQAIAAPHGYGLVGPSGAGHYVKMVHNGIEYALLEAYAEGFHLMKEGAFKPEQLDLAQISDIWMHGSIIRSYILELAHEIFVQDQNLEQVSGEIAESGTGQWTAQEAHEQGIPVMLIEDALKIRAASRETGGNYATKVVALLRHAFGGHAVKQVK